MDMKPTELKPYEFNKAFFESLPKHEYGALKADIEKRGLTNDLQITKSKVILCGHQRHKIALDLALSHVPCKVVDIDEADELAVKEYVIKDNLLRRHLKPEQRAVLEYELYKGKVGKPGGDRRSEEFKEQKGHNAPLETKDVYEAVAKDAGSDRKTIVRHIQYAKAREAEPERFKGKKVAQVLRELKKEKQTEEIKQLKPVEGKFHVIVVDPPWPFQGEYEPEGRRATGDYPTMSLEEIRNLKIPAEDDCILWLWGVDCYLKETLDIIEAWGFERKATLIWAKDKMGLGKWLRNKHEYCFLAVKGKPIFNGESTTTILEAPRGKHSEKPQEFYDLVGKTCQYNTKLDYFARRTRGGWTTYGDEVEQ
jgi:N6-adenosine-specific RNA methylase IME4/ParB-like chromosome segregation protein Spo0J